MRINNNVMALNAHRQLAVNQTNGAKSMERLSSGMRINRAGDDAAGLAISEKMRGQIRGLKQAQRNAQDGISLIQTAEGALNEIHAILQRMRELATQSATDTNTGVDRKEIQEEINQLAAEITRIADTTEFNTQNLLGGQFRAKFHIGANSSQNVDLEINNMDANALKVSGNGEGKAMIEVTGDGVPASGGTSETALVAGEQELDVVKLGNETLQTGEIANYGLANDKGEIVAVSQDGKVYTALAKATQRGDLAGASAVEGYTITFQETVDTGKVTLTTTENASGQTESITNIKATGSVDVTGLAAGSYSVVGPVDAATVKGLEKLTSGAASTISHVLVNADNEAIAVSGDGKEWFAVSDLDFSKSVSSSFSDNLVADAKAIMTVATALVDGDEVQVVQVKADGGIDVSSQVAADKAITVINEALETVSAERSKLGAMQNRLEHTIANLGTSAENLQAAESRIRDLDMAEEIMAFTKNNILQQAATAMLAQANMAPQSVLQLLG